MSHLYELKNPHWLWNVLSYGITLFTMWSISASYVILPFLIAYYILFATVALPLINYKFRTKMAPLVTGTGQNLPTAWVSLDTSSLQCNKCGQPEKAKHNVLDWQIDDTVKIFSFEAFQLLFNDNEKRSIQKVTVHINI